MKRLSLFSYIFCSALIVLSAVFYYPKWEQGTTEATLSWDVSGYYFYLPAIFIYNDVKKLEFKDSILQKYTPTHELAQAFLHPSGNYVMKYSCGQALQYLPWFAVGHLLAKPLGYPADGFSKPYQYAIGYGSLLLALIGLWFLRKNLLFYFSDQATAITLILLVWGSNYLNYSAFDGAMTHNWLFTLYALLIYCTIRFYQKPTFAWAAAIGLLVGWAVLTRPTEIISALIPVLWGIGSKAQLTERMFFFKKNTSKLLVSGLVAALVGCIQLVYWKFASGSWLVYSYQEQGFSWLHPHILDCLFSARAGWLTYSPVMIFAIIGLFLMRKQQKNIFPAVLIFVLGFMYLTFAWDIWWYGGSLGQRAMVQSYPVWAFPMAAFAHGVAQKNWGKWALAALSGILIYFNLWITHQAHRGGLYKSEQMTKYYFLKILGKYEVEPDAVKLLDTKEEFKGERKDIQLLKTVDFEQDTTGICPEAISGARSFCLTKERQFSPEIVYPVNGKIPNTAWVRCSATIKCTQKEWDVWKMAQFVVRFTDGDKNVKERSIRVHRLLGDGETKNVFFDTKVPTQFFNQIKVFFWNGNGNKILLVDDVKIEGFQ